VCTVFSCLGAEWDILITEAGRKCHRALSNVADEGLLKEGFFWIPSLAGPTSLASRNAVSFFGLISVRSVFFWCQTLACLHSFVSGVLLQGGGLSWLFPLVDGAPPIGWHDAVAYLVMPVLLIVSQYLSMKIMQPPQQDEATQQSNAILKFLPIMIGTLQIPSYPTVSGCII
jgi:YidC/Oxa1 family membrane protein insertase